MSPHEQPDDLGRLLNDAVSDIEPRSGIQAIRSRTSAKESVMTTTRNWIFGAFGAAVATAAVITGVVVAGNNNQSADNGPGVSNSPTDPVSQVPTDDPTGNPTDDPTGTPPGDLPLRAVPVYYLGDTPQGPRLYREFHSVRSLDDPLSIADKGLVEAVEVTPDDPDYRSPWPAGTEISSIEGGSDYVTVSLRNRSGTSLHDRPAGMSEAEAAMAIEQLIYTAQAGLGKRLPVQFLLDEKRTDQLLGVPTSEPLANGPVLATLAHVNITTPEEGETVSGDTLTVTGVCNSNEATILVKLQRYEGTEVVDQQPFTADGWMGNKLFPFSGTLDISGAAPGTYILSATTDDPSGGAEGFGPHTDTKIITIE